MIEENLLAPNILVSFCANKDDWGRLLKLAKKLRRPYSASLLTRIFIREGLERMEKQND